MRHEGTALWELALLAQTERLQWAERRRAASLAESSNARLPAQALRQALRGLRWAIRLLTDGREAERTPTAPEAAAMPAALKWRY